MIGLAAKKGAVASGTEACERELRKISGEKLKKRSECALLILAGDSSKNTKDKFVRMSIDQGIEYIVFGTCSELGRRIGKGERSVMIVTDVGLARGIRRILEFVADENGGV